MLFSVVFNVIVTFLALWNIRKLVQWSLKTCRRKAVLEDFFILIIIAIIMSFIPFLNTVALVLIIIARFYAYLSDDEGNGVEFLRKVLFIKKQEEDKE